MFSEWLKSDSMGDYNSLGNGAGMRVSPCGFAATSPSEALLLSGYVTKVTHSHPEGLKGAEAITKAIFDARLGLSKEKIRKNCEHYYNLDFTLDEIRDDYKFDVTCQGSVPQAIKAFLESDSFEDAIRNAISIGVISPKDLHSLFISMICSGVMFSISKLLKILRYKKKQTN